MEIVPKSREWTYQATACAFAVLLLFGMLSF
jgi:hypothetical protein